MVRTGRGRNCVAANGAHGVMEPIGRHLTHRWLHVGADVRERMQTGGADVTGRHFQVYWRDFASKLHAVVRACVRHLGTERISLDICGQRAA